MNAPMITDAAMPGLATALSPGALARDLSDAVSAATSGEWSIPELDIVRLRYRRGQRAILQVDLALEGPQGLMRAPGSVWFFAGGKAAKKAASAPPTQRWQLPRVFLEPRRECLVSIFPHDRHVPQIATFLANPGEFASELLGARIFSAPRLVRYRPGIGATFRWQGDKGTRYVKVHGDRSPARLAASVRGIAAALGPVIVPEPLGIAEEIAAVSYREVEGPFLDGVLAGGDVDHIRDASERAAGAMHVLHGAGLDARRANSRARFIEKAEDSALLIAALSPDLGAHRRSRSPPYTAT